MTPLNEQYLVFTCTSAKTGSKKLSSQLAEKLISSGIARNGTLQDISHQLTQPLYIQKRMIFINDCRSGCVRVIANRFDNTNNYIYLDISSHVGDDTFDMDRYFREHVIPLINSRWPYL